MRTARLLLAALVVVAISAAVIAVSRTPGAAWQQDSRSVVPLAGLDPAAPFDPSQSAALFVGVREFEGDVSLVRYAADDAVDLAYAFSLGGKSGLVEPGRVVLALSGEPRKAKSIERLQKLKAAGATISPATAEQIRALLRQQAARVTSRGILITSFATHGFLDRDGTHYLLGRTSRFEPKTSLSATEVLDVAAYATRSLVLVDACRERVPSGSRSGYSGPESTAPLITRMTPLKGQVVLYAAPHGGYAFDNDGNGVFTKAILEGLTCKGTKADVLNVEKLHRYVDKRVREWVEKERPGYGGGVQINMEGSTRLFPLANCNCVKPRLPVDTWRAKLNLPISRSKITDLDGDCTSEVLVRAGSTLHIFDAEGELLQAVDSVRDFVVGETYAGRREILAHLENGFSVFDEEGEQLSTVPGPFRDVELYRPTARFDNRVVATTGNTVLLFKSKVQVPQWSRRLSSAIESIEIQDYDNDKRLDLVLQTAAGEVVLDVDGHSLNAAKVDPSRRRK